MTAHAITAEERFNASWAASDSGCWEWTKLLDRYGYGHFFADKKHWKAHRWAYTQYQSPIPESLTIDHLCRNRACVNPKHMELVSNKTNVLRGIGWTAINARKTHCNNGHEFNEANTYIAKKPQRYRICRACLNKRARLKRTNQRTATLC